MASGTVYLDVDDEITSAAQRIRGSAATKVALVVPAGSRISTSRMNFRLLSREAVVNNRRLSIVAADPATRALAASAGLPVFASVAEYDAAIAGPPAGEDAGPSVGPGGAPLTADEGAADGPIVRAPEAAAGDEAAIEPTTSRGAKRRSRAAQVPDETQLVMLPPEPATATGPVGPATKAPAAAMAPGASVAAPSAPPTARLPVIRGRPALRVRAPLAIAGALIALAVVVAGVAAYVFLPSAEIRITPREEPIGPISLVVVADPDAVAPDANVDPPVVPATRIEIPIAVSDTFTTAGKRIEETAATGEVTFRNVDFTATNTIAAGSIVATEGGIRFRTDRAVTVPRAKLVNLTIIPSEADVAVTAVKKGTASNVDPNTITVIPAAEDPVTLSVRNKAATTGGTHAEFPRIEQADVDAAIEALTARLPDAFSEAVSSGEGVPDGSQVFEATAVLGAPTPSTDPASLVGQEVETFDLELTATGSVIAVDATPVEGIAEARLLANVGADHRLVADSVHYDPGEPTVENGQVTFPISARAARVALLDPAELLASIKGQSVEQAKETLSAYGAVDITTWPEWVSSIPGMDSRVTLEIVGQGAGAGGPSPSPSGSGS